MEQSKAAHHQHFKLNKPFGYLSQFASNAKHQQKMKFISALYNFPKGTMPIGRLDKDSEGLLLLTTDGKLGNAINKGGLDKEYYVQVDGNITESALAQLRQGVTISHKHVAYTTKPCEAKLLEQIPEFSERGKKIRDERHGTTSWVSIVISEGKFRQVRKMTASVGFPTLRLVRVRIGNIHLGQMQAAEVIPLKQLV